MDARGTGRWVCAAHANFRVTNYKQEAAPERVIAHGTKEQVEREVQLECD
jgi:hypothetical protein